MKAEEYIAEVMPDGHLSLPESIAKILRLAPRNKVRVIIERVDEAREAMLSHEAKTKALAIREYITDMGPEDLSERFRERYK